MSSFLDKLLSPSVRRDIAAMGVGRSEEADIPTFEYGFNPNQNEQQSYEIFSQQVQEVLSGFNLVPWNELSDDVKNLYTEWSGTGEQIPGNLLEAIAPTTNPDLLGQIGGIGDYLNQGAAETSQELSESSSSISSPTSFGGIGFNPLSRESILENLPNVGEKYREGLYEGNTQNLLESVKPLTMEQIRKTTTGFYNPYIEKEKKPLVDRLIDKRKTAKALGGDFAGYGQREQYQDIAEGSFMSGVENIYSDVDAARASALDDLYGTIASWQDVGEIS